VRLGRRLQAQARRLWRWFFPERVQPPPEVARVLAAIYPTLDLGAVSFHRGLPHLIRLLGSDAIVLPHLLVSRRTCVYVAARAWDPGSVEGLGTLIHEAYHALQAQEAGWGFGPLRPFLVLYFAYSAANGFRYSGHPMENGAYELAGRRRSRFETALAGTAPTAAAATVAITAVELQGLATASTEVRFWPGLARSLAFAPPLLAPPLLPLWLLASTGAASLFWLLRLLVEGMGASIAILLRGIGALGSGTSRRFSRRA
jgi:hypothetical protein